MTELPSGITLTCNEHGRRFIDIDHPSVRALRPATVAVDESSGSGQA